jgi:carboxylesterase
MEMNKSPLFQNPDSDGGTFFWPGRSEQTTAVLLLHGFTATTVEVRPMAKFLSDQGYSVAGPLLPGHGVSPEELNHTRFTDWIAAAENMYLDLSKSYKRVYVLGESMGGLCSLWLASQHPEIAGVLVYAPALNIHKLWETRFIWPFAGYKKKSNIDLSSPWQGFNVIPLKAASELHKFQQVVRKRLTEVMEPILIFQGKLDKTIDPISSAEVLEWVSSEDKELVWLEESGHCILLDKQMEFVKKLSLEFIKKHE